MVWKPSFVHTKTTDTKLQRSQRHMCRCVDKMPRDISLQDRISSTEIRKKRKLRRPGESYKSKWRWVGYLA